jgi:tRNA-guanine family transglycosylase
MDLIYYTSRGLPPFISNSNLPSIQLALPQFYSSKELFKRISLPDYTSARQSATYLCIRDIMNSSCQIQGHADYSIITVPVPQNIEISIAQYMEFAKIARTEYMLSFTEEVSTSAGTKRARRSAKNAVQGLDDCLKFDRTSKLIGNTQGGKDIDSRIWCISEMKTRNVDGLVIGGFDEHDHGIKIREIIQAISSELADYDKILILSGPGRPLDIIYAAQHGLTHFETMWPFKLAAEGKALDISFTNYDVITEAFKDSDFNEPVIDLNDPQYQYEKGPITPGCTCLACKSHHQGYIHHLLKVKEMTGNTLIALHNTQVYKNLLSFILALKSQQKSKYLYPTFVKNFCLSTID